MVSSKKTKSKAVNAESSETPAPLETVAGQSQHQAPAAEKNPVDQIFGQVEEYAILLLDSKGTITSWNKGAERIKGYRASEIIGKNYRIFYTEEDRQNRLSEKLLEKARSEGRTNYDGWRVRKDGSRFWGSMTLTALVDDDGVIRRFLKVTRDMTDKKVVDDRLSNFLEELRLKNAELKKSEERYHRMISEVRDYAIILLDREGTVLDWNSGAQRLKGYRPDEIIGESFKLFYPQEEKQSGLPERLLAEAVREGSVLHEGWRLRKDGTRFWGNVAITALHDGDGKLIGFSKVTRDLTDKKRAEDRMNNVIEELRQSNEQLKESEERYHRMIEEVQDYAIVLLSNDGEVLNWNAGAGFIKGYSASEIIGKSFRTFYTKEDRENGLPDRLLNQARKEGRVVHEGWRVRKDGTRFWGSVVITALHNTEGDIIGFSKVTRDLTEKRHAEETLKSTAAQLALKNKTLERLNAELSSFSYVASHDLKEPLRKIQTFAARMDDAGDLSATNKGYLEKVLASAERMGKLIHDLLEYSEVSNDKSTFTDVDLNEVLRIVKNDLEVVIQEKDAIIKSCNLPVVSGLSHQFTQMFFNLISNSLKFSRPGIPPRIDIDCKIIHGPSIQEGPARADNNFHLISFTDNGIGFEKEFVGKIFQAFQRLHSKDEFSGTGIGLAIVKKVVENHNGVIEASSVPGEGSTFNVYLPATTPVPGY